MIVVSQPITFGYHSPLKSKFRHGDFPQITHGIYGGRLTKSNASLEHVKAHCRGGKTEIGNLALENKALNNARGNIPFRIWVKQPGMMRKVATYLHECKGIKIDGVDYAQALRKTIKGLIR